MNDDELLRKLEEQPSDEIPLLQDTESGPTGLFTDEEVAAARRRQRLRFVGKSALILVGLLVVLFIALRGVNFISFFAKDAKFEYSVSSFSVDETLDDGAAFSFDGSVTVDLPWSFDLHNVRIELLDNQKTSPVAVLPLTKSLRLLSGKRSEIVLKQQKIGIVDAEQLAKALNEASEQQRLQLNLKIITDARPHWFPFTFHGRQIERELRIDLGSALPSGQPVRSAEIQDLRLEEAADDSVIASAQVLLENPLPVTIAKVPKLAFKVYYDDDDDDDSESVYLGHVQITKSFQLKPKSRFALPVRAILAPAQDDAISKLVANHLAGRPNKLRLCGDSKRGTLKLNWINTLIAALDLHITVPGRMFEEAIKKIDVKSLNFKLDLEKPETISLHSDAQISYNIPRIASALRPQVERIAMQGSVHDHQGRFLAVLNVPEHPVRNDPTRRDSFATELSLEIPVDPRGAANIDELLEEMFWSEETEIGIKGTSSLRTRMLLGSLSLPKIPFSTTVSLPGFATVLGRSQPIISNLQAESIDSDGIVATAQVSLENPNVVTSQLGTMHFDVFCDQEADKIGQAWLQDTLIAP